MRTSLIVSLLAAVVCLTAAVPGFCQHERYMGEAYFESTMDLYQMGRYKEAVTGFKRFLDFAPHDFNGHYLLGHCYRFLGDYENAMTYYEKALAIKSTDFDAHYLAGRMLVKLNRPDRALTHFNAAREMIPEEPDAIAGIGDVHRLQGDYGTAADYYKQALALDPEHIPALRGMALLSLARGDREAALSGFEAALEHNGKDVPTLLSYAAALGTSDSSRAAELYERALALRPQNAAIHRAFADLLTAAGDTDRAQLHREKAAEIEE